MPWEQEAGTPNPDCTFQRGRVREAKLRVLVLQEVRAAFTEESKQRSESLQYKRNKDRVRQALRDRASLSSPLEFHEL